MAKPLFDFQRRPVVLGQILGKGGEGSVYTVLGRSDFVAKIYHKAVAPDKAAKLKAMSTQQNDAVRQLTAWPIDVLFNQSGEVTGFVMPNVTGYKDIHHLYSPKSRRTDFPDADFRFLLRSAANVARAFATIHASGTVIGDVNHGGIRVTRKGATVRLIDCDSFQISDSGRNYFCEVGVPLFTPPELQGKPFKGVTRTPNHDNFGLAVIIFHLLFMGRHPFAGRPLGKEDVPIERAISEYRFPYFGDAHRTRLEPPPNTLSLDRMGAEVATLFARAFGSSGSGSSGRPRADEWVNALARLESTLKRCSVSVTHHFPGHLTSCPWCDLEKKIGLALFGFSGGGQPGGAVNLGALTARLAAIQSPGRSEISDTRPPGLPEPSSYMKASGSRRMLMRFCAIGLFPFALFVWQFFPLAAIAAFVVAVTLLFKSQEKRLIEKLERQKSAAKAQLDALREEWKLKASEHVFVAKKNEVQSQISLLANMNVYRQSLLKELDKTRQNRQLEQFLDTINIVNAKIPGIGPSRAAVLASYNIETALDVVEQRLWSVPGFGSKRIATLMAWRRIVQARFVFRPNQPHSAADLAEVERKVNEKRIELERSAVAALNGLDQLRVSILRERLRLNAIASEVLQKLAQVDVDLSFLRK